MSEATPEPTTDAEAPAQEQPAPDKPSKVETDWKAEAKKWESRAKENKSAAEKLAAIEEANKTEAQRAAERLAAAEKAAADATRDALRYKVASKFQISEDKAELLLTASDEETLTKQAQAIVAQAEERKKQGNFVPREGTTPATTDLDAQARQILLGQ